MNELSSEKALFEGINHTQNKNPLVSVIVPTFRRQDHLARALNSLIRQTYKPLEIVIVDDNGNIEWNKKVQSIICQVFRDERHNMKYICNASNMGSAEARNIAIKSASGEYISFLDDDDEYLPQKIERQLSHMISEQSDYSITDMYLFHENGRLVEKRTRHYIKNYSTKELLKNHLMYHMTGTDTLMFKREYLCQIGCFPTTDVGDEFYLMVRAITGRGRLSYLSECHVNAYVHYGSEGLSSGETKISGENALYNYKKQFFNRLDDSAIQYIKMRHYAVLAYANLRRKNGVSFAKNATIAFLACPIECIRLVSNRGKG